MLCYPLSVKRVTISLPHCSNSSGKLESLVDGSMGLSYIFKALNFLADFTDLKTHQFLGHVAWHHFHPIQLSDLGSQAETLKVKVNPGFWYRVFRSHE